MSSGQTIATLPDPTTSIGLTGLELTRREAEESADVGLPSEPIRSIHSGLERQR